MEFVQRIIDRCRTELRTSFRLSRRTEPTKWGIAQLSGPEYSQMIREDARKHVVVHLLLFLLSGMILDGGFFFATSLVAVAAYWVGFAIVVVRHPASPTRGDLIWASAGFAIALALTFAIGPLVLYLRGRL